MKLKLLEFKDETGAAIKGVSAFCEYKTGFVILANSAIYTNLNLKEFNVKDNSDGNDEKVRGIKRGKTTESTEGVSDSEEGVSVSGLREEIPHERGTDYQM